MKLILLITAISIWVEIGMFVALYDSIKSKQNLTYSQLILSMICGLFSLIIVIFNNLENNLNLPKWMYKKVIEHIK